MVRADFFIIGCPKCGTTALAQYLGGHMDICITRPKEPHFFAADLPGYQGGMSREEYDGLFQREGKRCERFGEASVYYLFSRKAVDLIYNYNPGAHLIVMLRNPVSLVHSLHSQLLYSRNEDISSFEEAWNAQEDRARGKRIPKYCTDPSVLQYGSVAMLGAQIDRLYKSSFPLDQIKVILFDEFVKNTHAIYEDVLSFLDVKSDGRTLFPVVNANSRHRFSFLGGVYVNTPPSLTWFVKNLKNILGVKEFNLASRLKKMNTIKKQRPSLSVKMERTLQDFYADDIDLLGRLLKQDLSCWLD